MAISKIPLSGSAGGRQIKVVATATVGTAIHATGISATDVDEVWLYATNQDTAAVTLTVEYGGTTSPDDLITLTIPPKAGLTLVMPGTILIGTGSAARTITAFASSASKVLISGYVNRLS